MMSDKTRTNTPPAGVGTRDELWAENERLRGAGDALAGIIELWLDTGSPGRVGRSIARELLDAWWRKATDPDA